MDRHDTESTDVRDDKRGTEILELVSVVVSGDRVTASSAGPGVVCRFDGATSSGDKVIAVGLDLARWREIPTRGDEIGEVAVDTTEPRCMVHACSGVATGWYRLEAGGQLCLCESHRLTVGRKVLDPRMAKSL